MKLLKVKSVIPLTLTATIMLSGMTAYELLKQWFHPSMTIWESHIITIIFSSGLATAGAYFVARKRRALLDQLSGKIAEAERTNQELTTWTGRLEGLNKQISLLSQMSNFMQSCQSVAEASTVIAQTVKQLFPEDSGAVFAFRSSRNRLEVMATWGSAPSGEECFAPDDCWAIRLGREYHFAGSHDAIELKCRHADSAADTYVCVPMTVQGEVIGSFYLRRDLKSAGRESERWFSERQRTLRSTAEQTGLVLWNIKLREELRNLSIRDPLTGLFNRRFMEESFGREFVRAERKKASLGVIMLDIDHFKRVNDTFGHEAGDAVLREIGSALLRNIRESDIACRYGGEEFILILPEASLEASIARAESLREKIAHLGIVYANRPLGTVTASAGVAVFPEHGSVQEALLNAADTALYQAKRDGRDRVCVAAPVPEKKQP